MVKKLAFASLIMLCSFFFADQPFTKQALAHGPSGNSILDFPRCSARLTACQLPIASIAAANGFDGELSDHTCMDGMGFGRSCALDGPFTYLSLATEYVERNLPALDPLSFSPCVDGFADRYPCQNVDLLSFLPLADIGGGEGSDLWGWTDPETGHEYALVGRTNGTAFVDVTNPTNPQYLGDLPSYSQQSAIWRDIKVYADHAFIVQDSTSRTMDHGLQIFDLHQLRNVANPPIQFETTAHYPNFRVAHNIAINDATGYAYIVEQSGLDKTCPRGLHMVDISTPTQPKFAGCFDEDGYSHDTQCVIYRGPDFAFQGREICFTSDEDALTIVDVSNKQSSQLLSAAEYASAEVNQNLKTLYVHQGWLTEDQRYFLQNDEADEAFNLDVTTRTNIWDVSDLRNPQWLGFHDLGTASSDHNLYIQGPHVYESNYSSGLRVLQLDQLSAASLTEVAYFDTSPENDDKGFNGGAWSSYPYFRSGNVIVSTITEGLFVLSPQLSPEFMLIPTSHHLFMCSDPAAQDSIGTLRLPPDLDRIGSVQVAPFNNYSGNIELTTVSTAASGTVSLGSSVATMNATTPERVDVSIQLQADWPAGTYTLTVLGNDKKSERTAAITVQVASTQPTAATNLLSGASASNRNDIEVSWATATKAELYLIDIATDANFANIVETGRSTDTAHRLDNPLAPEQVYYWRVRAINGCGETLSATATFQTKLATYMPVIQ